MNGRRVLVTGGAGFIGSNLANALASENDVIVVDDCSFGTPAHLTEAVDVRERSVLESELPTDVDVVFHLAARSSYEMHEADPAQGVRTNVEGFVNVADQARADGCETIVYASTSSVYGTHTEPTRATRPVTASTAYEASKLARERYAEYLSTQYGLSVAGMRMYSVYEGFDGAESHKGGYANVVAQFADDIANDRRPIVYGDGTQTRDFTHVSDVVRALVRTAESNLDGVYNVGTGRAISFNDLIELLAAEFRTDVTPKYVENPIDEAVYVHDTIANADRLTAATGWEPTVSIRDGVKRVCETYADE
ncbi:MAG: NAD-dependent epimerase/dehydratase family protein [Halobacteriota archaeon]